MRLHRQLAWTIASLALADQGCCRQAKELLDRVEHKEPTIEPEVKGLKASGSGPTLSWEPLSGAALYAVVASDGKRSRWAWLGRETSVMFGSAGGEVAPELAPLDVGKPRQIVVAQRGRAYSWYVTALDSNGHLLGLSKSAKFKP